jgi:hypothetical protein
MAPKINPALLLALGAGAYLVFTDDGQELLSSIFAPAKPAPPQPPTRPQQAPIMPMDPWSALIATAGNLVGGIMPDLSDRDSDVREGLRNFDRAKRRVQSKLTFGAVSDPKKKEKKKKAIAALIAANMRDMETFVARAHGIMARGDVAEWVIDTPDTAAATATAAKTKIKRGRISVYLKDRDGKTKTTPYVLYVPSNLDGMRLAVLAEPVVRATGGFTQRGGRLAAGAPFVYFVDDETGGRIFAFSDANPYAPPEHKIGQIEGWKRSDQGQAQQASELRRKLSPSARGALDQRIAENLKAGRPALA